jgi:hypothetical protein
MVTATLLKILYGFPDGYLVKPPPSACSAEDTAFISISAPSTPQVLALGSKSKEKYQGFGRLVDRRLTELGSVSLCVRGELDDMANMDVILISAIDSSPSSSILQSGFSCFLTPRAKYQKAIHQSPYSPPCLKNPLLRGKFIPTSDDLFLRFLRSRPSSKLFLQRKRHLRLPWFCNYDVAGPVSLT